MCSEKWCRCDSRSDMEARLRKERGIVFELLTMDDANALGYLSICGKRNLHFPVMFADIGLIPLLHMTDEHIVLGIGDAVAFYDYDKRAIVFKYKMPTVFHDFVEIRSDYIILQDEIGFVSLTYDGAEKWVKLCDDIIGTYKVESNCIVGKTITGEAFRFDIFNHCCPVNR